MIKGYIPSSINFDPLQNPLDVLDEPVNGFWLICDAKLKADRYAKILSDMCVTVDWSQSNDNSPSYCMDRFQIYLICFCCPKPSFCLRG